MDYNFDLIDAILNKLFEIEREIDAEEEIDDDGDVIYSPPPLDDVWLDEKGCHNQKERLQKQRRVTEERQWSKWGDKLPPDLPDHEPPPLEPRNLDDDVSSDDSSVSGHYESEG